MMSLKKASRSASLIGVNDSAMARFCSSCAMRLHAHDDRADRQAEGVAQRALHLVGQAAQAQHLHGNGGDALGIGDRQPLLGKAQDEVIERRERRSGRCQRGSA